MAEKNPIRLCVPAKLHPHTTPSYSPIEENEVAPSSSLSKTPLYTTPSFFRVSPSPQQRKRRREGQRAAFLPPPDRPKTSPTSHFPRKEIIVAKSGRRKRRQGQPADRPRARQGRKEGRVKGKGPLLSKRSLPFLLFPSLCRQFRCFVVIGVVIIEKLLQVISRPMSSKWM